MVVGQKIFLLKNVVKNIKEQTTFKTPNWKGIYSNIYISFNDVSARI